MRKLAIGCLSVVAAFFIIVFGLAIMVWNQRGEAVDLETQIKAQLKSNQSNYDNMWKRFTEMTQVTDIQAKQFKNVYTDLISGRNQDTHLLFKMVQEQNPQLNGQVYTKLQNEISSGRTEFDRNQNKILDMIAEYNRLVEHRGLLMAMITGRKPLNSDKYIITSERTEKAFEKGKDDQINLSGGKQ